MKKQTILLLGIIIISLNIQAQITDKLLPKRKNLAYFDSLSVYKNLVTIKEVNEKIFVIETGNKIYINDFQLNIISQEKNEFEEKELYSISYTCSDDKKNKYYLVIYFAYGQSYKGNLIQEGTEFRYGFSHNF